MSAFSKNHFNPMLLFWKRKLLMLNASNQIHSQQLKGMGLAWHRIWHLLKQFFKVFQQVLLTQRDRNMHMSHETMFYSCRIPKYSQKSEYSWFAFFRQFESINGHEISDSNGIRIGWCRSVQVDPLFEWCWSACIILYFFGWKNKQSLMKLFTCILRSAFKWMKINVQMFKMGVFSTFYYYPL